MYMYIRSTTSHTHLFNVGRDAVTGDVGLTSRHELFARQHLKRRRLSGAVDAEQTETLAWNTPTNQLHVLAIAIKRHQLDRVCKSNLQPQATHVHEQPEMFRQVSQQNRTFNKIIHQGS